MRKHLHDPTHTLILAAHIALLGCVVFGVHLPGEQVLAAALIVADATMLVVRRSDPH